jgi:quinoprotein glucose dehydrogenase
MKFSLITDIITAEHRKNTPMDRSKMNSSRRPYFVHAAALCKIVLAAALVAGCGRENSNTTSDGNWPAYAADNFNSKYSALDEITRDNVKDLKIAWTWDSPDNEILQHLKFPVSIYEATPLAIDGILYVSTSTAQVAAINGTTGKTLWTFDPKVYESTPPAHGAYIHRGVSYWEDGNDKRIIVGTPDARLIALRAEDGLPVKAFGNQGTVDLTKGLDREFDPAHYAITSPPVITNNMIVIGSSITDDHPRSMRPPGDVRAFDVRSGTQQWVFHTIPHAGEYGNDTWENDSWKHNGNTNVWTRISADEKLGYVYLPVSTPTNDWYGGNRPGENLFAESLVCLNVRTGKRVWHFQTVHHGVWNYDLPCAPNLIDITVDGKRIRAVAQVTKMGFTFVFDRETGKPVWPIEEVSVPSSHIPGEKTATTQPIPKKPASFERQGISEKDLIDFTPGLFADAKKKLDSIDTGPLYTPPSLRGLAYLPGALGGANWHGAATDPETGTLYVPSVTFPTFFKVTPVDVAISDARYEGEPFWINGTQGLPLLKPPYGRVTAIDLNTGKHTWMSPLGEGPRNHALLKDLRLPRLGWSMRGSPLLTRTLLFVGQEGKYWEYVPALVGSAKLSGAPPEEIIKFHPRLYVFDKENGTLIHEIDLPLNITGAPMTYRANGKQFIAFAVGGAIAPAQIIALSLQ